MRRDKKINKTMRLTLVTYQKQGDANRCGGNGAVCRGYAERGGGNLKKQADL